METLKSLVAYTQSATTIKILHPYFSIQTSAVLLNPTDGRHPSCWTISPMMISVNGAWLLLTFGGTVLSSEKNARGLFEWSGCPSPLVRPSTCASGWNCDSCITHSRRVSTDSTWKFSNTHRWYRASICSINLLWSFKYRDPFPSSADPLPSLKLMTAMPKRSAKFSMSFKLFGRIGLTFSSSSRFIAIWRRVKLALAFAFSCLNHFKCFHAFVWILVHLYTEFNVLILALEFYLPKGSALRLLCPP